MDNQRYDEMQEHMQENVSQYIYKPLVQQQQPNKANSFVTAALITGITAIVLAFITFGILGILVAPLGILFAVLSRGRKPMETQAKVGLGLSIGAMALSVLLLTILVGMSAIFTDESFQRYLEDELERYGYEDYFEDYDQQNPYEYGGEDEYDIPFGDQIPYGDEGEAYPENGLEANPMM